MGFYLPEWLNALPDTNTLKSEIFEELFSGCESIVKVKDCFRMVEKLHDADNINDSRIREKDLGCGNITVDIGLPKQLYYDTLTSQTGISVNSDADIISFFYEMSEVKKDYDRLRDALDSVRSTGYGVVIPDSSQMNMQEPQIVKQGGKYSVKLRANAPAIHMIMTDIETEVTPAIGGETASEDIINFLLQGFDGDVNRIWESNIFGKSLYDIAEEGLTSKIEALPEMAKSKLRDTLQRIINEGSGGLICILL